MTTTQTSADKTIMSPAVSTVYQRYLNYYNTTNNTTASTIGTYVLSDTTYPVMAISIADGSGGDGAHGLGSEYLSTNYSFGGHHRETRSTPPAYIHASVRCDSWRHELAQPNAG